MEVYLVTLFQYLSVVHPVVVTKYSWQDVGQIIRVQFDHKKSRDDPLCQKHSSQKKKGQ